MRLTRRRLIGLAAASHEGAARAAVDPTPGSIDLDKVSGVPMG